MPDGSRLDRTWLCSVLFMDIVKYSPRSVEIQMQLKERFNRHVSEAIRDVAENDRVMIDTGDGAAICFLGAPEAAMFAALQLRNCLVSDDGEQRSGLQVRLGINLGPVKLVKDINGNINALGDGINTGQRIMGFAAENQILVSRSFYEVVVRLSDDYEQLFQPQGVKQDKHVREHVVYQLCPQGSKAAVQDGNSPDATNVEMASAAQPEGKTPSIQGSQSPESLTVAYPSSGDASPNEGPHLSPVAGISTGRIIEAYEIQERLGEGVLGTVYRARQVRTGEIFAANHIRPELQANTSRFEKLKIEIDRRKSLRHPNIASIFGIISDGHATFVVTDFIEGETLEYWLLANQPMILADAATFLMPIIDALRYAHAKDLCHGSLNAANIYMTVSGPKLTNFGFGRQIQVIYGMKWDLPLGRAIFVPPEIRGGEPNDKRSDVYSLGVVLFQVLTGKLALTLTGAKKNNLPELEVVVRQFIREGFDLPLSPIAAAVAEKPSDRLRSVDEFEYAFIGSLRTTSGTFITFPAMVRQWSLMGEPPPPPSLSEGLGIRLWRYVKGHFGL
jgi:class 3 adenylate cyclase